MEWGGYSSPWPPHGSATVVAKFQPYKNKRNNTVDIIILLAIISGCISSTMYYTGGIVYPKLLSEMACSLSLLIVFSYLVFLILACVFLKASRCCKKCKTLLVYKIKRSEVSMGDRALLNYHGSAGYNSYS